MDQQLMVGSEGKGAALTETAVGAPYTTANEQMDGNSLSGGSRKIFTEGDQTSTEMHLYVCTIVSKNGDFKPSDAKGAEIISLIIFVKQRT
jgi:hypothetical protein